MDLIKNVKILADTLKTVDGGRVECSVVANNRTYKGIIENSFFADTLGDDNAPDSKKLELTAKSLNYLQEVATQQLINGEKEVVIR